MFPTIGLAEIKILFDSSPPEGTYVAPLSGHQPPPKPPRPQGIKKKSKKRRRAVPKPEAAMFMRSPVQVQGRPLGPPNPPPYSRQKPFAEWWNDPVTKDSNGSLFARRDYVLACAHKEGGAHIDPALDAEWTNLTRNNSLYLSATSGAMTVSAVPVIDGEEIQLGNPAFATVRQIAYEVDQTLRSQLAHLL